MIINILLYGFAILGIYITAVEILIPLLDIFFYACGYTVLAALNVKKEAVKRKPIKVLILFVKIFKNGFFEAISFLRPNKITQGEWVWIPLFRFKRKKNVAQRQLDIFLSPKKLRFL